MGVRSITMSTTSYAVPLSTLDMSSWLPQPLPGRRPTQPQRNAGNYGAAPCVVRSNVGRPTGNGPARFRHLRNRMVVTRMAGIVRRNGESPLTGETSSAIAFAVLASFTWTNTRTFRYFSGLFAFGFKYLTSSSTLSFIVFTIRLPTLITTVALLSPVGST